jgi:hypothetical protein
MISVKTKPKNEMSSVCPKPRKKMGQSWNQVSQLRQENGPFNRLTSSFLHLASYTQTKQRAFRALHLALKTLLLFARFRAGKDAGERISEP